MMRANMTHRREVMGAKNDAMCRNTSENGPRQITLHNHTQTHTQAMHVQQLMCLAASMADLALELAM